MSARVSELDNLRATVTTLNAQAEDLVRQRNEGYRQRDENFARASAAEGVLKQWSAWLQHFDQCKACPDEVLWCPEWYRLQNEAIAATEALSAPPAEAGPPVDGWGITISLLSGWASETLEACQKRGWAVDWSRRGAYLFLECAELVESLRGKGDSTPAEELADVFTVLLSIIAAFKIDLSQTFRFIHEKRQKILSGAIGLGLSAAPAEAAPRVTEADFEALRKINREAEKSRAQDAALRAELGLEPPAVAEPGEPSAADRLVDPYMRKLFAEPLCQCGHARAEHQCHHFDRGYCHCEKFEPPAVAEPGEQSAADTLVDPYLTQLFAEPGKPIVYHDHNQCSGCVKALDEIDALRAQIEEARADAEGLRSRLTTMGFERASFRDEGQRLKRELNFAIEANHDSLAREEQARAEISRARAEERAKTLEEAAQVVEGGDHLHANAPSAQWARQVAALIRARATEKHPWAEPDELGPLPSSFLAVVAEPHTTEADKKG